MSCSDISATLDKRIITLGDVFLYNVTIPIAYIVSNSPVVIDHFDEQQDLVIVSANSDQNKSHYVLHFFLSSYSLGDHVIPTMDVLIGSTTYKINSSLVSVRSAFEQGSSKNLVTVFKSQGKIVFKWWNYLLLLVICGIISMIIIFLLGKFNNKDQHGLFSRPEPIDPFLDAIKKLDQIRDSGVLEQDIKQFYFEVSFVVKQYLTLRYQKPLLESTTFEIKAILPQILNKKMADEFYRFFIALDPVKYAAHLPTINESKGKINQAKDLLESSETYIHGLVEESDVL
ncbi:MAG: hypothetical protein A2Y40_07460 [Candidatus Margulisbacteria bacterium GWF2_35_9]|nr:MAG: hypothetical protein A2Y40_07460 [Candidatus Margulisbacteria bacterium GWF2_35_9]